MINEYNFLHKICKKSELLVNVKIVCKITLHFFVQPIFLLQILSTTLTECTINRMELMNLNIQHKTIFNLRGSLLLHPLSNDKTAPLEQH